MYSDGTYRANNPDWHARDSAWKARLIDSALTRNRVDFSSCTEVGCGAGHVLQELARIRPGRTYRGYDISPDAAGYWTGHANPEVSYLKADFRSVDSQADLLLLLDVFEHVEDYLGFLRSLSGRAAWFVFHIPLDMHVSGLLRDRQLFARSRVGHLHYFSRATALATLADTGYTIVDASYTHLAGETEEGKRLLTRIANVGRAGLQAISVDLAAKLLGGYSLLVLCRGS